ncbi:MAG: ABC transporter substrate-binding protein [Leucobacter sp.]
MKKTNRLAAGLALAAAAALALTACSSDGGSGSEETTEAASNGEVRTVKVATVGIMSDVALQIADEQGYLEAEGLEVEQVTVANPPAGVAALQGGQVEFAFSPGVVFVNARSQGVPVKIVAGASGFPEDVEPGPELDLYDDTGVYVAPDSGITSLKDLEGKSIAVNARKANLEATVSKALLDEGVDPKSINWVALDFTSMGEALKNGEVDAAVPVNPFTLRAEEDGMKRIASPATAFFGPGASSFWLTSEKFESDEPEVVAGFQRAMLQANEYANEHLDESIEAGIKVAGLDIPVEKAGKIYWPTEVTQENVDIIADNLVEIGFLPDGTEVGDVIIPVAK